ncbi:hypothetical protein NLJ89_g7085 [Agrocybe chaxingu]|uniref:Amino acid permease/ SLC12A domain-containing protein n=1 Tax=Agrocybe chaxingu TaxID=84603 RepID=A0A9W8MVD8_9AGAR|nr:hypothetical protein NLJ89_g7085 [Agrocybe chaxingu]
MASEKDQVSKTVSSDTESLRGPENDPSTGENKLVRQLKNRHIAMISIGGVIGTGAWPPRFFLSAFQELIVPQGLFLGTATSLQNGGPVGLLLGYITMGTICYTVMISLGEMIAYLPIPGGHIKLAERFVDPALSFTMGWNYWYNWTIILPAELSAAAVLIGYWDQDTNPAVWITVCLIVVVFINMLGAGAYGEAEFIFASIKVITIVGLIILGIILDLGGGPNRDRLGFRYWKNPGPFVQYAGIAGAKGRFLGWWAVLTQAAFSFIGTEIVAIAAGEAKNPRRNLPRAIRRVYIRILLFYVGGTAVIGLLVPSNDSRLGLTEGKGTAAASPFVIAIERAGIKALPSATWSAASSDLYTSSRALYGLAASGNAPSIFLRTSKNGLPYVSVIFNSLFAFLAYMGIKSGSGRVFGWFANMTAIAGLMTWVGISITYIRFYAGLKAQGYDRTHLPFASKLQPYAAWYALVACLLISLLSGWAVFLKGRWATDTFVTNYLPLALFPIIYDEPPPRNKIEAFWQWLM